MLANALVSAWYKKHPLLYLLVPAALVYQGAAGLKRLAYRYDLKKPRQFPVPIIVVGNITVGGTGKTPLIIELARQFSRQGYRVGIVSRGYASQKNAQPRLVKPADNPYEFGDEPVLLARRTSCPVVICANRVAAVDFLLAQQKCDLILSDDGMQHYALGRDIEIAVIDGARRFGNRLCLPAGPLREGIGRLKSVDFIVTQGEQVSSGEFSMQLQMGELYNLQQADRVFIKPAQVHAVAGIGNPQRFFSQLSSMGFTVIEHSFPDHYHFKPKDIDFGQDGIVIMTEKDAVKCEKFADERHWCLPVKAELDADFFDLLVKRLKDCIPTKQ